MTRRIKRIAPLQTGKMLAVIYACLGLIFLPLFALAGVLGAFAQGAQSDQTAPAALVGGIMVGMGIFMPIIYGVMGLIFGVIGAALIISLLAGLAALRSRWNSPGDRFGHSKVG